MADHHAGEKALRGPRARRRTLSDRSPYLSPTSLSGSPDRMYSAPAAPTQSDEDMSMREMSAVGGGSSPGLPSDSRRAIRPKSEVSTRTIDDCMDPATSAEAFEMTRSMGNSLAAYFQDPVQAVTIESARQVYLGLQRSVKDLNRAIEIDRFQFVRDYTTVYHEAKQLRHENDQLTQDNHDQREKIAVISRDSSKLKEDFRKLKHNFAEQDREATHLRHLCKGYVEREKKDKGEITELKATNLCLQRQHEDDRKVYGTLESENEIYKRAITDLTDFLANALGQTNHLSFQLLRRTLKELGLGPWTDAQRQPSTESTSNTSTKNMAKIRSSSDSARDLQQQISSTENAPLAAPWSPTFSRLSNQDDEIRPRTNTNASRLRSVGLIQYNQGLPRSNSKRSSKSRLRFSTLTSSSLQQQLQTLIESEHTITEAAEVASTSDSQSADKTPRLSRKDSSSTDATLRLLSEMSETASTTDCSVASEDQSCISKQDNESIIDQSASSSVSANQNTSSNDSKPDTGHISPQRSGSNTITLPLVVSEQRLNSRKSLSSVSTSSSVSSPTCSEFSSAHQHDHSRTSDRCLASQSPHPMNVYDSVEVKSKKESVQIMSEKADASRPGPQQHQIQTQGSMSPENVLLPASKSTSIISENSSATNPVLNSTVLNRKQRSTLSESSSVDNGGVRVHTEPPSNRSSGSASLASDQPLSSMNSIETDDSELQSRSASSVLSASDTSYLLESMTSDSASQSSRAGAASVQSLGNTGLDINSNSASDSGPVSISRRSQDNVNDSGIGQERSADNAQVSYYAREAVSDSLTLRHRSTSEHSRRNARHFSARGWSVSPSRTDVNSHTMPAVEDAVDALPSRSLTTRRRAARIFLGGQRTPSVEETSTTGDLPRSTRVDSISSESTFVDSDELDSLTESRSSISDTPRRQALELPGTFPASNLSSEGSTSSISSSSSSSSAFAESRVSTDLERLRHSPFEPVRPRRWLLNRTRGLSDGWISFVGITNGNGLASFSSTHVRGSESVGTRTHLTNAGGPRRARIVETENLGARAQEELRAWGEEHIFSRSDAIRSAHTSEHGDVGYSHRSSSSLYPSQPPPSVLTEAGTERHENVTSAGHIEAARTTLGDVLHWIHLHCQLLLAVLRAQQQLVMIWLHPFLAVSWPNVEFSQMFAQLLATPLVLAPFVVLIQFCSVVYFAASAAAEKVGLEKLSLKQWMHLATSAGFLYATYTVWQAHNAWYVANTSNMREKVIAWREECWDLRVLTYLRWYIQMTVERQFRDGNTFRST